MNTIPSKLLDQAVEEMAKMPGIGRRTALRLALWILKQRREDITILSESILKLSHERCYCKVCHNIADEELCNICKDIKRNRAQVCVVQDIRDVMAIEQTGQYRGLYHVLGGVISPIEGVNPNDLNIEALINRMISGGIEEVIMALNSSIEGDTTTFYLFRKIKDFGIEISSLARGLPVGDELEYADEVTLGRSILNRVPYEDGLKRK